MDSLWPTYICLLEQAKVSAITISSLMNYGHAGICSTRPHAGLPGDQACLAVRRPVQARHCGRLSTTKRVYSCASRVVTIWSSLPRSSFIVDEARQHQITSGAGREVYIVVSSAATNYVHYEALTLCALLGETNARRMPIRAIQSSTGINCTH
jgi:hypothetical protein